MENLNLEKDINNFIEIFYKKYVNKKMNKEEKYDKKMIINYIIRYILLFLNNNEKESIQLIKTKFNENSKEYKVLLIIIKITFHLKHRYTTNEIKEKLNLLIK